MPDKKDINVDDIVKEYATEKKDEPSVKNDENSPVDIAYTPDQLEAVEREIEKRPAPSHRYGKFVVSDVGRPNVSYINSVTEVRKTSADLPPKPTDLIEGYDGAVMTPQPEDETYVPRVRKMSNSTRAKEMREYRRHKRRKSRKQPDFTYAYESPDGIYTKPEKKSRKFMIHREALEEEPEPEDDGSLIPLSENASPSDLDINISDQDYTENEARTAADGRRKKHREEKGHSKRESIRDYDSYEDAKEIRRSINEIKEHFSSRMNLLIILFLISGCLTAAAFLGLPMPQFLSPKSSPMVYTAVQLILLAAACAFSISTLGNGLRALLRFKPDSDSIAALSVAASAAAAVSALFSPELVSSSKIYIYTSAAILCLMVNVIGKKKILNRMAMNFGFISKSGDINIVSCVEDSDKAESFTRGTIGEYPILAFMKKANFIKDFEKFTYSADTGDRFTSVISPLVLIFSLLLSVGVTLLRARSLEAGSLLPFGLCIFSAAVSAASCMAIPLTANIPLEKAADKNSRNHCAMLGYRAVDDFYDVNSVMIGAESFFPTGTVRLSSFKLFSETKIDEAFIEAASLASHGNSVLRGLFSDIAAGKGQQLRPVESFVCEDSLGLCGWIGNKRVLLGSRELMVSHNIEGIPTVTKEKEYTQGGKDALYLSVSGNLSAMFIIEISASKGVLKLMKRLADEDMVIVVRTIDPFVTISRISSIFGYPEELLKIVPPRLVEDYNKEIKPVRRASACAVCTGRFVSFMRVIMGAKRIRNTVTIGLVLQSLAALSGFVLVTVNTVLNALPEVSPLHITAYQLGCTLLTALILRIRKV